MKKFTFIFFLLLGVLGLKLQGQDNQNNRKLTYLTEEDGLVTKRLPPNEIISTHPLNAAYESDINLKQAVIPVANYAVTDGSTDAIINNNVFLQGQFVEVGVAECGCFGTTESQPAGYHGNVGSNLGFVADPDKDGWAVGSPAYNGDYFLPGSPEEGFGVEINGSNYGNFGQCGTNDIPMISVAKDYRNDSHFAYWTGTIGGLQIEQEVSFEDDETYFLIKVDLTNTNSTDLSSVYYMRNVDPDNENPWTGNYTTINSVQYQPDPTNCNKALVQAVGQTYGMYLGLAAVDSRARVTHGGFSNRSASAVYNGTGGLYTSGTVTDDAAISIAFNLGTIAAGETKTLYYAYVLDASQVNNAIGNLTRLTANGQDITSPLIFSDCLQPVDLIISNGSDYSWTWSPATYLSSSTGTEVILDAPAGVHNLTATGTNACGNTLTYNFTVELADDVTAPEITCPGNQEIEACVPFSGTGLDASATDNCSLQSLTHNYIGGGTSLDGIELADGESATITWLATDSKGLTSSCSMTVTGKDNTVPTVNVKNGTVYLDSDGTSNIDSSFVDNGSYDACGIGSITLSKSLFTCADIGNNTITVTVNDVNGNSSQDYVVVTVIDTVSPVAVCKPVTVYLDATGQGTIAEDLIDNGSTDACGIQSIDTDVTSFSCSDVSETNTVTLTVTDVNGNISTCSTEVTVIDTISPVAVCKPVTVYLDAAGEGTIAEDSINNGSTDACGILSFDTDVTSFSCSDVSETNPVTLTVTDVNGNSSTCNTVVTVLDTISPVAQCKPVTVYLDATGQATIAEDLIDNGSTDACGGLIFDTDVTSFSCSDVSETNPVTLTVTDANGNSSTCNTEVTVLDTVSPVAQCKPVTVYLDEFGQGSITEDSINDGSTDACGGLIFDTDVTSFSCSDVSETNIVELTVTDVNGNSSTCNAEVTVIDTVSPVAVCKPVTVYLDALGQATIAEDSIDNGSADACGGLIFDTDVTSFSCSDVAETNIVELTVTDVNGNSSTCTSEVTVIDTVIPVTYCKDTILYLGEDGVVSLDSSALDIGSTDACGIASIELSQSVFRGVDVGKNQIENIVTDINGNVAICTSTVTVRDTIAPELWCQNIGINLDINDGQTRIYPVFVLDSVFDAGGIVAYDLDSSRFDCSDLGKHIVELSVTDVGGNVSTCTAEVTVVDHNAPIVVCKDTLIVLNEDGFAEISVDSIDGGSTDACGIAGMELSQSVFTGADLGENIVTLYVTDVNGNTDSCNAVVTVTDEIAPVAVCNIIEVLISDTSGYELSTEDLVMLAAGSTDNATPFDSLTIEVNPSVFTCDQIGDSVNVEVTVIDEAGNASTCETKVLVGYLLFESELPALEVSLDSGMCETTIDYPEVLVGESCGELTLVDGLGADGVFAAGTHVEIWQVVLGDITDTVSFEVIVSSENLAPTLYATADTTVLEDELVVELTGISDGGDCVAQEVAVSAVSLDSALIETIEVSYVAGSSTAELSIAFTASQSGEAEIVVTVEDEAGATVKDTFVVTVDLSGVVQGNNPPILVDSIADTTVMATYTLDLSISKTLGVLFDDVDDDSVIVSVAPIDGVMPDWIIITEDETMYSISCNPTVADTGCYEFVVSATDTSGAMAADTFELCVLALPVGVGDISQSVFDVTMYPNPSKGMVNIELESSSTEGTEISVSNVAGAEVFRRSYISGEQIQIDLSENVSGMYLIRVTQNDNQVIKKLILDKN